ncbi:hypothetical protein [Paucisalibacillus sp. EB02]|uniref:hypothetical protein n=1 Tax=Paucisalibacillus sp. EB02 TaxID=1347087 RepID=UPI0005AB8F77|nr:hypothetical protein [Paucisalibacillus sp. EB02]
MVYPKDGWYAANIAFALRDIFANEVDLANTFFKQFMEGYTSQTSITEAESDNIVMFLRFQNLLTYTKLLNTLDLSRIQIILNGLKD